VKKQVQAEKQLQLSIDRVHNLELKPLFAMHSLFASADQLMTAAAAAGRAAGMAAANCRTVNQFKSMLWTTLCLHSTVGLESVDRAQTKYFIGNLLPSIPEQ
jgi:hypothetical protein